MTANELSMTVKLENFIADTTEELDKYLKQFRCSCKSDFEFSKRMRSEKKMNIPEVEQYFFDNVPVFYTEFVLGAPTSLRFLICPGEHRD